MIGEFFVEYVAQKDDRFGIKTSEVGWINGFGMCPEDIIPKSVNKINYHIVEKNGNKYYDFGDEKAKQVSLKDEVESLKKRVTELENRLSNK